MVVIYKGQGAHIIAGVTFTPGHNTILPAYEKALKESKHFKAQLNSGNMRLMSEEKQVNPDDKGELTDPAPTGDYIIDEANGILALNKKDAVKVIRASLNISALMQVAKSSKNEALVTMANQRINELKEKKE